MASPAASVADSVNGSVGSTGAAAGFLPDAFVRLAARSDTSRASTSSFGLKLGSRRLFHRLVISATPPRGSNTAS